MTLKEFREKTKDLPGNTDIRIQLGSDDVININLSVDNIRQVKTGKHGKIKEIIFCSFVDKIKKKKNDRR